MPLSAAALRGFFEEVDCFTLEKQNNKKARLISDGVHVYSDQHLFGKAYGKFFYCIDLLTGKSDSNKEKVEAAFVHASHASRKLQKQYMKVYVAYEGFIRDRIEGKKYDVRAFTKAQCQVADFIQSLFPVYRKIQSDPDAYKKFFDVAFSENAVPAVARRFEEKGILWSLPFAGRLQGLFHWTFTAFKVFAKAIDRILGKSVVYNVIDRLTYEGKGKDNAIKNYTLAKEHRFSDNAVIKKMKELAPIVHLEVVSGIEFPVEVLSKVFRAEARTDKEDQILNEWVERLCAWRNDYAAGYFHAALEALVGQLNESLPVEEVEMQLLKVKLSDAAHLFTTPDPDQVRFKEKEICPGTILKVDGFEYTVKEQLFDLDGNTYFELSNNCLLRVPQNRCVIALDAISEEKERSKNLEIMYRDPSGRYAFIEGNISTISDIEWLSDRQLLKTERNLFERLTKHLRDFIDDNSLPEGITPYYYVSTQEDKIKAWQSYKRRPLDLSLFLDYVSKLANGNQFIYKLFVQSLDIERVYGKSFKHLLEAKLENKKVDYRIFDTNTQGIAKKFEVKAERVLSKCRVAMVGKKMDAKDLKRLNQCIMNVYQRSCLICKFPKDVVEQVVEVFIKKQV